MRIRFKVSSLITVLLAGALFSEARGQPEVEITYHPGWLESDPATTLDVSEGWPLTGYCCYPYNPEGDFAFGVSNPDGNMNFMSDFFNPSFLYPDSQTCVWVFDEGAYLESTEPVPVTEQSPWLFVQFSQTNWDDGSAEIEVREQGGDWVTVGTVDTFARLHHWFSVEGLPFGQYYVRITARWAGRSKIPPEAVWCGSPADHLHIARIGTTVPVPPEDILITGGGWITVEGGRASLVLEVRFKGGDTRPRGTFNYVHHGARVALHSTEILGLDISDNLARVALSIRGSDGSLRSGLISLLDASGTGSDDQVRFQLSSDWSDCVIGWVYEEDKALVGQVSIH